MATAPVRIEPPAAEAPLAADTGQHTKAWSDYHQSVSDRLGALPALMRRGVTDGSEPAAGDIGEYLMATFGATPLTNDVPADLGPLPLTAGDWDVSGQVVFTATAGAIHLQAWVSEAAATPLDPNRAGLVAGGLLGSGTRLVTGPQRVLKAAAGPVFLGAYAGFASGTASASGTIWARRVR